MTTIQIALPDELAQEAADAGILSPERLEEWVRQQLRASRSRRLFEAMDRMHAVDAGPAMSPEEVAEEIAVMRAEKRSRMAG